MHQEIIYCGERSSRSLGAGGAYGPRVGNKKDADYALLDTLIIRHGFARTEMSLLLGYSRWAYQTWRDRGRLPLRALQRARALVRAGIKPRKKKLRKPQVLLQLATVPLRGGRRYALGEHVTRRVLLKRIAEYNRRQGDFEVRVRAIGEKEAWLVRRRRKS